MQTIKTAKQVDLVIAPITMCRLHNVCMHVHLISGPLCILLPFRVPAFRLSQLPLSVVILLVQQRRSEVMHMIGLHLCCGWAKYIWFSSSFLLLCQGGLVNLLDVKSLKSENDDSMLFLVVVVFFPSPWLMCFLYTIVPIGYLACLQAKS